MEDVYSSSDAHAANKYVSHIFCQNNLIPMGWFEPNPWEILYLVYSSH